MSMRREGRWLTIEASLPQAFHQGVLAHLGVRRVLRPLRRLDPSSFVRVGNDIRAFESNGPPSRALFLGFAFLRFVFGVEQALYDLRVMRIAGGEVPQLMRVFICAISVDITNLPSTMLCHIV